MKLSLQLFTVREAMQHDPAGTLQEIAAMSLKYVETAGTYGLSATQFRSMLDAAGLACSGAHVSLESLEGQFESTVSDLKAIGSPWAIVPYISEERRDYSALAGTLNKIGRQLAIENIGFAYHNHDFEIRSGGLNLLLSETNDAVFYELDLGWIQFAGGEAAEYVSRFGERAKLVHLKDMLLGADNPHVVAGEGSVDWHAVKPACEAAGIEYGVIEMDHPPFEPIKAVRACVEYFRSIGIEQ